MAVEYLATASRAGLMGAGDKNKVDKSWTESSTAPTASTDSTLGYFKGATIYVTTTQIEYFCTSDTPGAAVWRQRGGGSGGSSGANLPFIEGLTGGSE